MRIRNTDNNLSTICHFLFHTTVHKVQNAQRNNIFISLLFHILLDPDPEKQFRIQAKVPDPCGSGSTTLHYNMLEYQQRTTRKGTSKEDAGPYLDRKRALLTAEYIQQQYA